jgi:nitroimidazol reductase NimA-like FMN-containing flavoprotein (pyridoxamine 5'-phosphate oxidase superfamily)
VGVSVGALPAIFPVNYAMLDGQVVFRTGPGTKLDAAAAGAVVAFEIDDIDLFSHTGWSVLVVGVARPITEPETLARARRLPLSPWVDGERDTFVRLESARMTGRELRVLAAS